LKNGYRSPEHSRYDTFGRLVSGDLRVCYDPQQLRHSLAAAAAVIGARSISIRRLPGLPIIAKYRPKYGLAPRSSSAEAFPVEASHSWLKWIAGAVALA